MGVSVIACKISCSRTGCKIPTRELSLDQQDSINAMRGWYESSGAVPELLERIQSIQTTHPLDELEKFDKLSAIMNYHDKINGIVDFGLREWLCQYLENDACTHSGSDNSAITSNAFFLMRSALRFVEVARSREMTGEEMVEFCSMASQLTSLPSNTFLRTGAITENFDIWVKPTSPRTLSYLNLIANGYAMCIEEIAAARDLEDREVRNEKGFHHIALAIDILSMMWRTLEEYSCEGS